ncbi:hypothetical protein MMK62_003541 [Pseudomonas aeruginosa]|uniref:hypothetical protein n=1 Tax=Pseudomonas aeruginosa TaxID=287 RepID=UPI000F8392FD|nr:hypothetical protein [Pseudomonas aeruginosa]EIU4992724.1 hypothetical protein [Pseudomonas aeruginosa]EIY2608853.1 hypothetical protein [Pseudomonas aeruginosa]EIY2740369.1 hypothetical protein [Pseudomonas aeruginosa]EKM0198677.1 hypothetical protein [Pseudomonas aeruginosa]EKM0218309.1 hypothetical protein [Pseudomonas aeruginosa]
MSGIREEFEAWHHAEFGYVIAEEDDPAQDGQCAERWKVWQASRAALRVELPEHRIGALSVDGQLRYVDGWNDYRERAKEELKQAGIEVKNG